jgi:hypothetical protein
MDRKHLAVIETCGLSRPKTVYSWCVAGNLASLLQQQEPGCRDINRWLPCSAMCVPCRTLPLASICVANTSVCYQQAPLLLCMMSG